MRFLHTSDWHLGLSLHGASLLEEQRALVSVLADAVRRERVQAVVIAGDLFDHAVPTPDAVRLYSHMMETLCAQCAVPVLLCAGNHDGAARLSVCAPLLRGAGLFVAGSLSEGCEPVVIDDAVFYLLPYFTADEARWCYPDETIRGASDAMKTVCDALREKFIPGKKHILVSHCFAAGAETGESDRSAVLGTAGRVALEAFRGFDYVALGHLHRAQQLRYEDTMIRYSGTPYPYSFSEIGVKSFTVVDTDGMTVETAEIVPTRPVRVIEGTYDAVLEQAPWDQAKEDYLKIVLTDVTSGLWRMSQLREHYPNLLLLEGVTPQGPQTKEMSVGELDALRPEALVRRFCEEIGGNAPDEMLMEIFAAAAGEIND